MENPFPTSFPISVTGFNPEAANRYFSRLATSFPSRAEENVAAFLDPVGVILAAKDAAKAVKTSYDEGALIKDAKRHFIRHASSPEAMADATLDLFSIIATRKPKALQSTNADETAIASFAAQNLPGQEKKVPYVFGEKIKETFDTMNARYKAQEDLIRARQRQEKLRKTGTPEFTNPFTGPSQIKK